MTATLLTKAGGLLAASGVRVWMRTLDIRAAYYDPSVDIGRGEGGPAIYVFWHEYILFPLFLNGNCNVATLLSRSRDANILARVALHLGYDVIRGSTYRGAASAVRELIRTGDGFHFAITPDGPRGPRRTFAQGPVYLASRLGLPLIACGLGYNRPWRAKSWDRFAIPRPYSRARAVVAPPIHVPPDLNRDGIEAMRIRVEQLMRDLTEEAEAWAKAGTRKIGEEVTRPRATPIGAIGGDLAAKDAWEYSPMDAVERSAA